MERKVTPKKLMEWRDMHGYTQQGLADELGVHRVTVAKWEAGMALIPPFLGLALFGIEKMKKK